MMKGLGWGYASGSVDRTPIGNARKRGVPFYILKTYEDGAAVYGNGKHRRRTWFGETVGGVSLGLFRQANGDTEEWLD